MILLVITSQLSGNYCNYLAIIAIIKIIAIITISWQSKELPTKYEACDCHYCLSAVKWLRALGNRRTNGQLTLGGEVGLELCVIYVIMLHPFFILVLLRQNNVVN